jgi:hypothetical protein
MAARAACHHIHVAIDVLIAMIGIVFPQFKEFFYAHVVIPLPLQSHSHFLPYSTKLPARLAIANGFNFIGV